MANDRCANCRFFARPGAHDWVDADCRRHAPTRQPVPNSTDLRGERMAMWPHVQASDWCGDFAPATPPSPASPTLPPMENQQ